MEKELSPRELKDLILRLCEDEALELIRGGEGKIYIPFIMNDAVEAYCLLTDAIIPAAMPDDLSMAARAEITEKDGRTGLIIRSEDAVLATVWYKDCVYKEQLYQYHRIMHCWADGNEHMRMLVYMIGTMRDKYEYLGAQSCNDAEKSLMPLLEYRPFRFFSPLEESIDAWYPETKEGREAMKSFAEEAGETQLLRLMRAGKLPGKWLDQRISEKIAASGRLYDLIYAKICMASETYERRTYPDNLEREMQGKRDAVHAALIKAGYAGQYPSYQKNGSQITALEEHPFTVSEMDDMEFAIHLLLHSGNDKKMPYRIVIHES